MWSGSKKPIEDKSSLFSSLAKELALLPLANKLVIQTDRHMISISNDGGGKYSLYDPNASIPRGSMSLPQMIELASISLSLDKSGPNTFVRYIKFDKDVSLGDAITVTLAELKKESKDSGPKAPGGPTKTQG